MGDLVDVADFRPNQVARRQRIRGGTPHETNSSHRIAGLIDHAYAANVTSHKPRVVSGANQAGAPRGASRSYRRFPYRIITTLTLGAMMFTSGLGLIVHRATVDIVALTAVLGGMGLYASAVGFLYLLFRDVQYGGDEFGRKGPITAQVLEVAYRRPA